MAPDPRLPLRNGFETRMGWIRDVTRLPIVDAGDFSYYDDPAGPERFDDNVLYAYGPERLVIGRYCAIGTGVRFIMAGANHRMDGPSTYPFPALGGGWEAHVPLIMDLPSRGDTVIGNDVWIGYGATIMPGVTIGHGAIIGSMSVVTRDVRDYAIVGGNPAREVRRRFDDATVARLLAVAWWDWDLARVDRHVATIMAGDVTALEAAARD